MGGRGGWSVRVGGACCFHNRDERRLKSNTGGLLDRLCLTFKSRQICVLGKQTRRVTFPLSPSHLLQSRLGSVPPAFFQALSESSDAFFLLAAAGGSGCLRAHRPAALWDNGHVNKVKKVVSVRVGASSIRSLTECSLCDHMTNAKFVPLC